MYPSNERGQQMITRDKLKVEDKLTYLPAGIVCEVVDLDHYCIWVKDEDGSVQEIPPEDNDLYEPLTS
jgi:hypothetical protein